MFELKKDLESVVLTYVDNETSRQCIRIKMYFNKLTGKIIDSDVFCRHFRILQCPWIITRMSYLSAPTL